jgi:hypothetical protein
MIFWDTSESKNFSFDDENVSALNEQHFIDFTTKKGIRKPKSRKRESPISSEWERQNENATKYRTSIQTLKRRTDVSEGKIDPLWGH